HRAEASIRTTLTCSDAQASSGCGIELQRGRVDAVPEARRIRSVVKDVTEVSAAGRAGRLGAGHEQGAVCLGGDRGGIARCEEARPARTRLELRLRSEELGVTAGAPVDTGPMLIPQLAAEGSLGALLTEHPVLLRG